PKKGMAVVKASVRPETPQERVLRYLQQTVAVKDAVLGRLEDMSEEVLDPALRQALGEHRALTGRQREEVEARLRRLGRGRAAASGGKGLLERMLGWVREGRPAEPDDLDRSTHDLLEALTAQEFEVEMSRYLGDLAQVLGDGATAALAER